MSEPFALYQLPYSFGNPKINRVNWQILATIKQKALVLDCGFLLPQNPVGFLGIL